MAFAAEARALHGGALPHPGLVCLFSSRSRASMSRSVRIKCQHGDRDGDRDRDRDSRQPECLQTHRMDPNLTTSENMIKKRGGKMREEGLNNGGGGVGKQPAFTSNTQSYTTAVGRRGQEPGKKGIKEERGARSGALQK